MNILKDIYCQLADLAEETGLFNRIYEYVELVQVKDGKVIPRMYEGNGYKDVQNFDVNGLIYFRKNGTGSIATEKGFKFSSCSPPDIINLEVPIKVVACVLREKFNDKRFADTELVQRLMQVFQADIPITNIQKCVSNVRRFETEGQQIWAAENQGVGYNEATLLKFAYVSLDLVVNVRADVNCIDLCNPYY